LKQKNRERVEEAKEAIFDVAIILKGVNGIIEFVGGIFLFFISSTFISRIVARVFSHELGDDPRDFLANYAVNFAQNLTIATKEFIALYIFIHGIINLFLFTTVMKKKYWAYPIALVVLCLLIVYQVIRLTHLFSWILCIITIVDVVFIYLMYDQYTHKKRKLLIM